MWGVFSWEEQVWGVFLWAGMVFPTKNLCPKPEIHPNQMPTKARLTERLCLRHQYRARWTWLAGTSRQIRWKKQGPSRREPVSPPGKAKGPPKRFPAKLCHVPRCCGDHGQMEVCRRGGGLWVEPWPLRDDNWLHSGPLLLVSFVCFFRSLLAGLSVYRSLFYLGRERNQLINFCPVEMQTISLSEEMALKVTV